MGDDVRVCVAEKKDKEEDSIDENGQSLSTQQVEMLLNVLCEETDIAEISLKLDGFKMKVRRSLDSVGSTSAPAVAPAAAPVAAPVAAPAADAAPSVYDDDSDGETDDGSASTVAVKAPKVGVLRRGRYLKGKQIGKGPVVEEGATVKKGQPLCYIEQLGTFWPVESPQAGEVLSFLVEEGEAVEYLEEVVDIAPFFGGHIIGDSKYA
jgi:biotin carboxyl carrier protein